MYFFSFKEKLKFLRGKLRVWNVEVYGFLDLQEDDAIKDLFALDFVLEDGNLVDINALAVSRALASKKVWETMHQKEYFLRQKARATCDSNSRFFS